VRRKAAAPVKARELPRKKVRPMADYVEEYLAVWSAFGLNLSIAGRLLGGFAQFVDQVASGTGLLGGQKIQALFRRAWISATGAWL
jgi:predicted metal-binding membrane protein